ncbi:hypothetical protein GCM10010331_77240 [Streptomyces xanthochromogenes]|uniref:hypothetical protein n=1 Tax=Streptomyces xanthochromogenes TaxID=67384 RepID=UPI0016731F7F|nr:hypothetical protein [Streptomyces xanthochromogenes]GHB78132.1 hypothetical protein GCM10010331_77240 [Streptomyces xanthochromogenes]
MTDGSQRPDGHDAFQFHDNSFRGPFQTEGVQHNNYYSGPTAGPPKQKWWRRRAARAIVAVTLLLAAAGGYGVYVLAKSINGGNAQAIQVSRPLDPGSATLPSYVHLQAQEDCASDVHYYAETAADYEKGDKRGQRSLGPVAVDITSQTSSDEAVLLVGMRVLDVQRQPLPTTGIAVQDGGCGGQVDVRPFATDLAKPDPPIFAEPSGGHPPAKFPYKISPDDPEVFRLEVHNTTCFCAFAIELDWIAAGKAGKTILDNDGKGFLSAAAPAIAAYQLDSTSHLMPTTFQQILPSHA